ncbi:MAG: in-like serine protease, partial [Solirubrobacterales bacterium]|nr:in-like serine protease [Solirubrobacterales bacterium]
MKTRSTSSAAALLAMISGFVLLESPHAGAAPDDRLRVRVALEPGGSPSRTVAVQRPRLTPRELRLVRSHSTPERLLARIASRQQDRRALDLRRVSRAVRATGRRLALLSAQLERRGMVVEKVEPLSGSLVARVAAAQLPALKQMPTVGTVSPASELVDQTAAYTSAAIGAPAFWGAGFIGGRGSADVNPVDLQILGDVAQQSNPALAGLTFVVPPGAPHDDPADDSHGTPVTDMAVGHAVTSCPTGVTCSDLDPARKGAAYGVDKVLNWPNSWGTSGQPGEGFDEVAWGLGITQVGSKGSLLAGTADPAEVDNESAAGSPPQPADSLGNQQGDNFVSNLGVVYFNSAGNYGAAGVGCVTYDYVCVGAFDPMGTADPADDTIPSYSSQGPTVGGRKKPDLVAVGSSQLARSDWQTSGRLWRFETGTSFSSPQAAGAALLLMGAGITDPLTVKAILVDSARQGRKTPSDPMGSQTGWQPDWGWGAVDMTQALAERTNFAVNPDTGRLPAIGPEDAHFYSGTTTTAGDRATLVWNRRVQGCPFNATDWSCSVAPYALTNLDLAEYAAAADPCATAPPARDASTSAIDNVEQVRSPGPGDVIYKVSSGPVSGISAEPYAMASTRQTTRLVSPKPQVTIAGADATLGPGEHA